MPLLSNSKSTLDGELERLLQSKDITSAPQFAASEIAIETVFV